MCPNYKKQLSRMKTFVAFGVIILSLGGMETYASGKQDSTKMKQKEMDHSKMDHLKMSKNGRKSLAETTKKSVISVLEANEKLHASFFKYDAKAVEANALKLTKVINAIKDKEISTLLTFSKTKLAEIKASNERETNNKNYHLVSMALIHVVNKYDVGAKYNVYSCPMVKKKWVQNSSKMQKVHNPYAPNMPHCGSQDSHH